MSKISLSYTFSKWPGEIPTCEVIVFKKSEDVTDDDVYKYVKDEKIQLEDAMKEISKRIKGLEDPSFLNMANTLFTYTSVDYNTVDSIVEKELKKMSESLNTSFNTKKALWNAITAFKKELKKQPDLLEYTFENITLC